MSDHIMGPSEELSDIPWQAATFAKWAASSLMDAAFLVLWWALQWFPDRYIFSRLELQDLDRYMHQAVRLLLAITTLAPILFYVIQDIARMWIRTKRLIRAEEAKVAVE